MKRTPNVRSNAEKKKDIEREKQEKAGQEISKRLDTYRLFCLLYVGNGKIHGMWTSALRCQGIQTERGSGHEECTVFLEQKQGLLVVGFQVAVQRTEASSHDISLPPPSGSVDGHDMALTECPTISVPSYDRGTDRTRTSCISSVPLSSIMTRLQRAFPPRAQALSPF